MNGKILIIVIQFFIAATVFAQDYQLLEPINIGGEGSGGGLSGYLETVFAFGISLAGILAVLMIVIGGIQYITAYGNAGRVENAKNRITQALLGLLLAICAWLILHTINPDLIKGTLDFSKYEIGTIEELGGGYEFGEETESPFESGESGGGGAGREY